MVFLYSEMKSCNYLSINFALETVGLNTNFEGVCGFSWWYEDHNLLSYDVLDDFWLFGGIGSLFLRTEDHNLSSFEIIPFYRLIMLNRPNVIFFGKFFILDLLFQGLFLIICCWQIYLVFLIGLWALIFL
jgi:hypothetical protein